MQHRQRLRGLMQRLAVRQSDGSGSELIDVVLDYIPHHILFHAICITTAL